MQALQDHETRAGADMAAAHRRGAKELSDVKGKISRLVAALEEAEGAPGAVLARIRELEDRKEALERNLAANAPGKVARLPADAMALYQAKVDGLAQALTTDATPAERAAVAAILPTLVDRILVKSIPGLRRLGQGVEVEITGPLPAYTLECEAQAAPEGFEQAGNGVLLRGRSLERVKGIEPSS